VLDHRLDRSDGRNRVDVRAEEQRRAFARPRQPAVEVSGAGVDPSGGVILVHLESQPAELCRDAVGDCSLLAGWARHRSQVEKEVEHAHRASIVFQPVAVATPCRPRARAWAAPTNSRNSGAGLVGRDLNSGWNWLATNQG